MEVQQRLVLMVMHHHQIQKTTLLCSRRGRRYSHCRSESCPLFRRVHRGVWASSDVLEDVKEQAHAKRSSQLLSHLVRLSLF